MDILKTIQSCAQTHPDRLAFVCGNITISYRDLWEESNKLANWLIKNNPTPGDPIAVYGHKHPKMLVCFLGCIKAGSAYCPIDISVPDARVSSILEALPSRIVLSTETLHADAPGKTILTLSDIEMITADADSLIPQESTTAQLNTKMSSLSVSNEFWVHGDQTFYIIFTSGSTGTPKGVQISANCLNHYLDWSVRLSGLTDEISETDNLVYLNQAPFSFDLSVMDLYTCLATEGTLFCLEKTVQADYKKLVQSLKQSNANVWVSTPSFADMCLSEKAINEELMPDLRAFLFCGEALGNRTVKKLQERFPKARIVNTYGPTESTVAVTDVLITPELNEQISPLPVGQAKPGTTIEIWDENGNVLPEGEKGEIIILGDTVSTGYYRREDLTQKSFFIIEDPNRLSAAGFCSPVRGYHTGDKGYLENGMLHYCGRIDLQIKLHGYRMELEDIESNIRKLPQVEHVVVIPNTRGGKVSSLTAFIVERSMPEDPKAETAAIKEQLSVFLPDYMIPKKISFIEQMPMTNNGKADRKLLGGLS